MCVTFARCGGRHSDDSGVVGDRWCPVTSGGARYCTLLCVRLLRRGLRNVGCGRRRRCASVVVTVCTASDATLRQYDVKQKQRCTALIDDHMRLRCERAPVRARSLSADGRRTAITRTRTYDRLSTKRARRSAFSSRQLVGQCLRRASGTGACRRRVR